MSTNTRFSSPRMGLSAVAAAALLSSDTMAFTATKTHSSPFMALVPRPSALQSAFINEDLQGATSNNEIALLETPTTEDKGAAKSFLDDGFIFGLEGSGLKRPKGKVAQVVVEGDSLETTNWQRAVVWGTFLGHFGFMATSFQEMLQVNQGDVALTSLQASVLLVSSWLLADFGSGVLHWSVDNYGNGRTPIMGGIIAAFQGHHSAPWTITERGFENNVYKLCVPFGIATMGIISAITGPFATFFLTIFCVLEILSQEFHKWSHMTRGETPDWVNQVQELGLTIGRKPHAQHHLAPYDGNYCIISGACNPWLDESGFFRRLEHIVYDLNGVESNAWKLSPELRERTLRGEYRIEK